MNNVPIIALVACSNTNIYIKEDICFSGILETTSSAKLLRWLFYHNTVAISYP